MSTTQEEHGRKSNNGRRITKFNKQPRTLKTRHAGPLWIRSASFSARLSEAL
jgi:hypothetical protein